MIKKALLTSWKTTLGGIIAGALLILQEVQWVLDSSEETTIDWNIVAAGIAVIWMAINSRDSDVSSERAGAL